MPHPQPRRRPQHSLPHRLNPLRKRLRLLGSHMRLDTRPPHRKQIHHRLPSRALLHGDRPRPLHVPHRPRRRALALRESRRPRERRAEVHQVAAELGLPRGGQAALEGEGAQLGDGVRGQRAGRVD